MTQETNKSYQVGDIFHCGWGYSMTLNDFYQVVGKSGKNTLHLKALEKNVEGDGWSGDESPIKDQFKQNAMLLKKRVDANGYIKLSSHQYAKPHVEGKKYYYNRMD